MIPLFCSDTVPIRTVNRQCSSGLQAVADVAASIKAGFYEIGERIFWIKYYFRWSPSLELTFVLNAGVAAGLESMSVDKLGRMNKINPKVYSISSCLFYNLFYMKNVLLR